MTMTRADFNALADHIRYVVDNPIHNNPAAALALRHVVGELVTFCKARNSAFDENRFRRAVTTRDHVKVVRTA